MFSLKKHARKQVRTVALSAAAASVACIAGNAMATTPGDNIYWDPGLTGSNTGGGTGSFDSTSVLFWNQPKSVQTAIFTGSPYGDANHIGNYEGDVVHFANTGGTVTVGTATGQNILMNTMVIDGTGYTFNPFDATTVLTLGGGYHGNIGSPHLALQANEDTTIGTKITFQNFNSGLTSVNVAAGKTLVTTGTIGVTNYAYGRLNKTGTGTWDMQGTIDLLALSGDYGLKLDAGTIILHGTSNRIGGALGNSTISSGGTLAGSAMVFVNASTWSIAGSLAPGNNAQFGSIGTLTISKMIGTMTSSSHLLLDIDPLGASNDVLELTSNSGTVRNFTINSGALIDINNGTGTLTAGTYHIITSTSVGGGSGARLVNGNNFAIGLAPAGYTYNLVNLGGGLGLDLVVGVLSGSTWSATGGAGNWSDSANWTGSVPNTAGSTASFGTGTLLAVNVDVATTTGNISFDGTHNYTISGSGLTLDNSGSPSLISALGGTQSIGSTVTMNNDLEISNAAGGGVLTVSGAISGTGNLVLKNKSATNAAITVGDVNNTGTVTNSGLGTGSVVISGALGANVTVVNQSSSSSSLVLTGASPSFVGTTNIAQGTLEFSAGSLGSTGVINFDGGTLKYGAGNTDDISGRLSIAAPSPIILNLGSNSVTFANALNSTNTSSLTVGSSTAGTLILTGAQTYTGLTNINAGATVKLAAGASFNNSVRPPIVNTGGTLDINGNNSTFGTYGNYSQGGLFNAGTVTNTGAHTTLTLYFAASGGGTYNGDMDLVLSPGPGGTFTVPFPSNVDIGTVDVTGTITIGPTTGGFYGPMNITNVGTNVTAITNNGRRSLTVTNLATNIGGTTLTAKVFTGDGTNSNITVTNTVTGNGNLIIGAGDAKVNLPGGINMSGKLINNSAHDSNTGGGLTISTVGSNVTGIDQNSVLELITVTGPITVNASGTTFTKALGSNSFTTTGSVSGSGNLIVVNNDNPLLDGNNNVIADNDLRFFGGTINPTGQIINNGGGTSISFFSGYAGGNIGSNVTALVQNSSTSTMLVAAPINVNAGGTSLINNGGADLLSLGGTSGGGNLLLKNNTSTDNVVTVGGYAGTVNHSGEVQNVGTGVGQVAINTSVIGANVTGVVQNSTSSALELQGTATYAAPTTVQAGKLIVSGNISTSATTVQSGGTLTGNGTAGSVTVQGGGHISSSGTSPLNVASLNMAAASTMDYNFAAGGASSSVVSAGDETTVTLANGVVLNLSSGSVSASTYTLVDYTGTNPLAGFSSTSGQISGGVVTTNTAGTIGLGSGWATAGNFNFTISNDLTNGSITLLLSNIGGGGATWIATSGTGLWSDSANWSAAVPNAVGASATFDGTGTLAAVNVDSAQTVGSVAFSGGVGYTISGSALTLDNTGTGNATISSVSAATQTISSQIVVANTNLDVSSSAGTLALDGGIDNTAGKIVTVNATGGTVTLGSSVNNGSIVAAGGNLVVNGTVTGSGSTTVNAGSLGGSGSLGTVVGGATAHTIHPSASLAATATTTTTMSSLTTSAQSTLLFNIKAGGFDQLHVTGNLDATAGGTVAVVDNSAPQGYYTVLDIDGTFSGTLAVSQGSLPSSQQYLLDSHHNPGFLEIHKVLIADANADGIVDGGDFDTWFTHLQVSTFDYAQGDFNNDGLVDGGDFDLWFTHLQNTFAGGPAFGGFTDGQLANLANFLSPAQLSSLGAAVPEPTSLALLGMGAVGLLSRRRRK